MTPLDLVLLGAGAGLALVLVAIGAGLAITIVGAAQAAIERRRPPTVHVADACHLATGDEIEIDGERRQVRR